MKQFTILLPLLALSCSNASAEYYQSSNATSSVSGEYRYDVDYVYDGDTIYIKMKELPKELQKVGIRVRGIDTPEIKGKCEKERQLAQKARQFSYNLIKQHGAVIYIRNIKWDKFGGRVDGDVLVGEPRISLAMVLLEKGLANPYMGGYRDPMRWCR